MILLFVADVTCGAAPAVAHATIEYTENGFEQTAHYVCDEGFFIAAGRTSVRCTGGGTWQIETPLVCERM